MHLRQLCSVVGLALAVIAAYAVIVQLVWSIGTDYVRNQDLLLLTFLIPVANIVFGHRIKWWGWAAAIAFAAVTAIVCSIVIEVADLQPKTGWLQWVPGVFAFALGPYVLYRGFRSLVRKQWL